MRISDWSSDVCSSDLAGGFLTEHLGWQSVFLVNLPIGLLAIFLAARLPKRSGSGAPFRFDLLGVLLFAVFIASTLVLLEQMRHFDAALLPAGRALGALGIGSAPCRESVCQSV